MGKRSYSLRPVTHEEFELIRDIKLEGLRPYVEKLWGWDSGVQERRFEETFDASITKVILRDGEVAGILQVQQESDSVVLVGVYLVPASRSQGLGAQIIADVQEAASGRGVPVKLRVLRPNPAQRLYRRLGFRVTGESESHLFMEFGPQPN